MQSGWYRNRSPMVAAEFRVFTSEVIRKIVQAPHRCPSYLYGARRLVLHRFPFSIVYLDDPETVNIVAVAHAKRKPGYWKMRV